MLLLILLNLSLLVGSWANGAQAPADRSQRHPGAEKFDRGHIVSIVTGASNDEMSSAARDATAADIVEALGRLNSRRKVLAIIGRSTPASPERQARLKAIAGGARDSLTRVLWFELQANECGRQAGLPTDIGLIVTVDSCAEVADGDAVKRVVESARRYLREP